MKISHIVIKLSADFFHLFELDESPHYKRYLSSFPWTYYTFFYPHLEESANLCQLLNKEFYFQYHRYNEVY